MNTTAPSVAQQAAFAAANGNNNNQTQGTSISK